MTFSSAECVSTVRVLASFSMALCACLAPGQVLQDDTAPVGPGLELRRELDGWVGAGSISFTLTAGPETAPQLPSVVVGVVSPRFRGVMAASAPGRAPLDGSTVLPLSSITKIFTGLLAAQDVAEGRFSASTPLSTLLASDLGPLVGDRTVLEAVTHSAGYSANPRNLAFATNPESPAAGYSREQLATCLAAAGCSLGPASRGQYLYSNTSVGLLGIALADHHQTSFEALVSSRISRPLGMRDTGLSNTSASTRWVDGLTPEGAVVKPATMGVLAPSGALVSTADDMLLFLDALLRPPPALAPGVRLATAPAWPNARIGWAIDRLSLHGLSLAAKSGEQAGYSSMLMWNSDRGVGVVALAPVGASSKTLAALCLDLLERTLEP